MALGRALTRRIGRLGALPRVLDTTEDKLSSIHAAAFQSLSEDDQRNLNATQDDDSQESTKDTGLATDHYNEAFMAAFTDSQRFTVAELDELLANN